MIVLSHIWRTDYWTSFILCVSLHVFMYFISAHCLCSFFWLVW